MSYDRSRFTTYSTRNDDFHIKMTPNGYQGYQGRMWESTYMRMPKYPDDRVFQAEEMIRSVQWQSEEGDPATLDLRTCL